MRLDIVTVVDLVTRSLPLSDWGFTESAKMDSYVIYNSEWCRIKFVIEKDRAKDYLHAYYGRLHALDNEWVMKWTGEKYYCWHTHPFETQLALEFLDDASPQEAYKRSQAPLPFFQDYHNSEFAKSISNIEERSLKLHSLIWKQYELRFFELFDLRHPNLWKQYLVFLKEYYKLYDEAMDIAYKRDGLAREPFDPPQHNKC